MREGGDGRNLLDQRYPTRPAQRAFHQLRHRQRSSRRQWERRPGCCQLCSILFLAVSIGLPGVVVVKALGRRRSGRVFVGRIGKWLTDLREGSLGEDAVIEIRQYCLRRQHVYLGSVDIHEKTGLSAGTVTDDDQLATDFSHLF